MTFVPTALRIHIPHADEGQLPTRTSSWTYNMINRLKALGSYTGSDACRSDPQCRLEGSSSKANAESEEYTRRKAIRD